MSSNQLSSFTFFSESNPRPTEEIYHVFAVCCWRRLIQSWCSGEREKHPPSLCKLKPNERGVKAQGRVSITEGDNSWLKWNHVRAKRCCYCHHHRPVFNLHIRASKFPLVFTHETLMKSFHNVLIFRSITHMQGNLYLEHCLFGPCDADAIENTHRSFLLHHGLPIRFDTESFILNLRIRK